jgi:predicted O-methyltransferase YrrM
MDMDLEEYIEKHSSEELPILQKIYRETHIKYLNPRMVCGHIQGLFLSMISKMIAPSNILEIGTFTGYSAICLAQGLREGGKLLTIEIDEEMAEIASNYIDEAGMHEIEVVNGDALEIISELTQLFDIIYIDGEKREYPQYLSLCLPHLKSGGFLIADNVLWSGKILSTVTADDKATLAVKEFNESMANNSQLEKVLLPLRDGIYVCRKK